METQARHDAQWMEQALEQARASKPVSSPNPAVGCVLVRDGACVGRGYHDYALRDHAEVVALREATEQARGATAYVTLEPCSHTGRTGPCAEALIAAGVSRVVVATVDPNPKVRGRGIARLRAAAIEVLVGVGQAEARRLNDGFATSMSLGRPRVTLKSAVSLDGRIAPEQTEREPSRPFFLTSTEALLDVQRLRHEHDALLTGIGTVLADDPALTDRTGRLRRRRLLRVVLDSHLRLPLEAKLVQTLRPLVEDSTERAAERFAESDLLVFCTAQATQQKGKALRDRGVRVEVLPQDAQGRVSLVAALERLGELGNLSVMIEAGQGLTSTALTRQSAEQLIDEWVLYTAPWLLGASGVPLMDAAQPEPLKLCGRECQSLGPDLRDRMILCDPWQGID